MKKDIFDTVIEINNMLSKEKIRFAFGASVCLYLHGIELIPNDIDIIVEKKDLEKLKKAFKDLKELKTKKSDVFLSKHFYNYELNSYKIDVISEFTIKKGDFIYKYPFDKSKIEYIHFRGHKIGISPLKDWRYLYSIMPNREKKVKIIDEYISKNKK